MPGPNINARGAIGGPTGRFGPSARVQGACADLVRLALARAQQKEEKMLVEHKWTWKKWRRWVM